MSIWDIKPTNPLVVLSSSPLTRMMFTVPLACLAGLISLNTFASAAVAGYGQCGGVNHTGDKTCISGFTCVFSSEYYSQCVPSSGGNNPTTTTKAQVTTSTTKAQVTTTTTKATMTTVTTKKTTTTAQVTQVAQNGQLGVTTQLPASSGYVALPTASVITGTFDGGMKKFDRAGSSGVCQGQTETGEADAVFILQPGATIQNVIIGAAQAEGIHCRGPCTVKNVWWMDVCEDAITIKQTGANDISYIIGGGAFSASDKIVQHNGAGTVSISNFFASTFGKLYRACGNCATSYKRSVIVNNVVLKGGSQGVGINSNFGDTATITNVCTNGTPSAANVCCQYQGTTKGNEPSLIGCGPSGNVCKYTAADVKTC